MTCPCGLNMDSDHEKADVEFGLKKIKMERSNNNCPSLTNSNILTGSPLRRKLNLPPKMHAIVQTNIPVAQIGCQTNNCLKFDAACQTSKELSKCTSCIEKANYRLQLRDASSQTDEIFCHDGSKSTTVPNASNLNDITPSQSVLYLSEKEDLELTVFQDVALIDLMIDRFYRYQLALLANVRHTQIKHFVQSILMAQIYGNMVNVIHTFLNHIISTTRFNSNISLISSTKLVNSLWLKQENICKSVDVPSELFTTIIRRCFTAMQGTQAANLSFTQSSMIPAGSTPRPRYNLMSFLNTTGQSSHSSYMTQNNYWSYGQNMSNNVVSSSTNSSDLPVLSVTDIREVFRSEEVGRNHCRY